MTQRYIVHDPCLLKHGMPDTGVGPLLLRLMVLNILFVSPPQNYQIDSNSDGYRGSTQIFGGGCIRLVVDYIKS